MPDVTETAKIYVPETRRKALIDLTHENMHHQSHGKVANELLRTYWWPSLSVLSSITEVTMPLLVENLSAPFWQSERTYMSVEDS